MKLNVWVTVGKPSESIFLETRSVTVDVPTDGSKDMQTVVFELPLGARLDGRGPIRVVLERSIAEAQPPRKGGLWGADLLRILRQHGVVSEMVQRAIIDCPHDDFVKIHTEAALPKSSLDLLPALVVGATVIGADPPAASEPVDPDEIPF